MSYWVYLNDPETGQPVEVSRHEEGGTLVLGGTTEASINVTWNYSKYIHQGLGLSDPDKPHYKDFLSGMTGAEAIPHLEKAVSVLGTERDRDYWASTPGNAGYFLSVLLRWAKQHPTAVFEIH